MSEEPEKDIPEDRTFIDSQSPGPSGSSDGRKIPRRTSRRRKMKGTGRQSSPLEEGSRKFYLLSDGTRIETEPEEEPSPVASKSTLNDSGIGFDEGNCCDMDGKESDRRPIPIIKPETGDPKVTVFEHEDRIVLRGSRSTKSAKMNFMLSLPTRTDGREPAWLDTRLRDFDEVSKVGGGVHFKVTNTTGPDIYEMFDLMPSIILEIMSKTTVGAKWDPFQSSVSGKFRFQHRVNARLMLGESIEIVTRHKPNRLPVAALRSQCIEPSFLTILRSCGHEFEAKIDLRNILEFVTHKVSRDPSNMSPWLDRTDEEIDVV